MFYCLQCSIDHLEFSRVLCSRPSWLFRCHLHCPLTPPLVPLIHQPLPPVQASSGQEWTTAGQHDIWSTCGSGWCFVICTPHPITPCMPLMPQGRGICWPRSVWTCVPLTWAHVQLSAVFSRPSWVFKSTPPPPVQASSAQEWYNCRSV